MTCFLKPKQENLPNEKLFWDYRFNIYISLHLDSCEKKKRIHPCFLHPRTASSEAFLLPCTFTFPLSLGPRLLPWGQALSVTPWHASGAGIWVLCHSGCLTAFNAGDAWPAKPILWEKFPLNPTLSWRLTLHRFLPWAVLKPVPLQNWF